MLLGERNCRCLKAERLGDIWETERDLGLVGIFSTLFGTTFWVSFLPQLIFDDFGSLEHPNVP
jgi:hypothetical protein